MPDELDVLKELGRDLAEPDDESVRRARSLLDQRIDSARRVTGGGQVTQGRRRRVLGVGVAALLIGSGFGFGLASFLTPSSSAGGRIVGFGFVTGAGWNVRQAGVLDRSSSARAVASSVPFDSRDESSDLPYATLGRLPADGAVIAASLLPRGRETRDQAFALRAPPLRVADAVPADLPQALSGTSLVSLRIGAEVDGYNVDVRIFFGAPPSPALMSRADEQLRRLVVAPNAITLVVQPRVIAASQRLTIFGAVANAGADEKVVIQFKACGAVPAQFRDAFETTTRPGGGFSAEERPFNLGVSGVFRAVSGGSVSTDVPVQQRPFVGLRPKGAGRFQVLVTGTVSFWRRHVLLQRFDRRRGVWITLRRLVLAEQPGGAPGPAPPFQSVVQVLVRTAEFPVKVARGTMIRAVLPETQARPCYLAGVSQELRV